MAVFDLQSIAAGLSGSVKVIEALKSKQGVITREEFGQVLVLLANARADMFQVEAQYRSVLQDNDALKKQIADFEAWNRQKDRYELHEPGPGVYVWSLKKEAEASEPAHWICVKCYEDRRRAILQRLSGGNMMVFRCSSCETKIAFNNPEYTPYRGGPSRSGWTA